MSRTAVRFSLLGMLIRHFFKSRFKRFKPLHPHRILIAHHLLLGDTLMLTPLLAKLHHNYPEAEIYMLMQDSLMPLYEGKPYGVTPLGFNPRSKESVKKLLHYQGFDLAIVPGDNRFSWLAYAMGSKWIVAFSGDRPAYKNWPVDEFKAYRTSPAPWPEMNLDLVEGWYPPKYEVSDWNINVQYDFLPKKTYAILHPGASNQTKYWSKDNWLILAEHLSSSDIKVIWGGGPGEQALIDTIDPDKKYHSFAEKLNLKEYWSLLQASSLLVCPDTGVAHLGRHAGTPTICLFGPGSEQICGKSLFWKNMPYDSISEPIVCRNQNALFKREIKWVQRCARSIDACPEKRCMDLITVEKVIKTLPRLC